jgi:Zn-dependent M32 family carboxypeptidase
MIICDRCQRKLVAEDGHPGPVFEFVDESLGIVACLKCYREFKKGITKISDEVEIERMNRIKNWYNEWVRNFQIER